MMQTGTTPAPHHQSPVCPSQQPLPQQPSALSWAQAGGEEEWLYSDRYGPAPTGSLLHRMASCEPATPRHIATQGQCLSLSALFAPFAPFAPFVSFVPFVLFDAGSPISLYTKPSSLEIPPVPLRGILRVPTIQ
ncbi:hypothetical protein MAP00_006214 [Monascus purpureus]|nr:hypothetical protein MAP00_006214 [Monascus purpureus]